MKQYPSIPTKIDFKKNFFLFDKLDGSNIRAEWNPKKGFYKFGSRTQLLTEEQDNLYPSIEAINNFVNVDGIPLGERLHKLKYQSAVCFFEWAGPNSFAGSHEDPVEDMSVTLIDVSPYKKGMLRPESFIDLFEDFQIPAILYNGKITEDIFQQIRRSEFPGVTFEGVVGKEAGCTKDGRHDTCKIKSNAWLNKLKEKCNGDEALFERLK